MQVLITSALQNVFTEQKIGRKSSLCKIIMGLRKFSDVCNNM